MQSLVRRHVRPGTAALDLGAHYGFYTLMMARLVGRDGRVIAFEPTPPNVTKLRQHVALNPELAPRITVSECAVGCQNGQAVIMYQGERASSGAMMCSSSVAGIAYTVPLASLDSMELPPWVSVIKIDVEWAEVEVLIGAERLLTSYGRQPSQQARRPVLLVACHSGPLHRQVTEILSSYGYRTQLATQGQRDLDAPADVIAFVR